MKKNFFVTRLIVLLAVLSFTAACGGGGGGGGWLLPEKDVVSLSTVTALYPLNGADWNDYVKGNSIANGTDTLCTAATDTVCMHAGEKRVVTVTGKNSCTGITATDSLGAFDWACDASTGTVRVMSTALKNGKSLTMTAEASHQPVPSTR
jgi:hypothetical protein